MPTLPALTLGRALATTVAALALLLMAGHAADRIVAAHQCTAQQRCDVQTWIDSTTRTAAEDTRA